MTRGSERIEKHAEYMRSRALAEVRRGPKATVPVMPAPPISCDCGVCEVCADGDTSRAMLRARRAYERLAQSATEGKYDELYRDLRRMIPRDSCASLCARAALFDVGSTLDSDTQRRIDRAYRLLVPPELIQRAMVPDCTFI